MTCRSLSRHLRLSLLENGYIPMVTPYRLWSAAVPCPRGYDPMWTMTAALAARHLLPPGSATPAIAEARIRPLSLMAGVASCSPMRTPPTMNALAKPARQSAPGTLPGSWAHARRRLFKLAELGRVPLAAAGSTPVVISARDSAPKNVLELALKIRNLSSPPQGAFHRGNTLRDHKSKVLNQNVPIPGAHVT